MQALILWDARLLPKEQRDTTDPPVGNEVKRVDEFTDLASAIFWIGWKADQYAKNVSLIIMAHGQDTLKRIEAGQKIWSPGGSGLIFCRQGITLTTLPMFEPIKGKVKKIELRACAAAYITAGFEGGAGDGNLLCYKLAQITGAYVRASTADQGYGWYPRGGGLLDPYPSPLHFDPWRGTVVTYAPTGAGVTDYPAGIR